MGQLPWLDEKKLAREHPRIFHYTCEAALEPILKSGGLFATHYGKTNDSAEARVISGPLTQRMVAAAYAKVVEFAKQNKIVIKAPEEKVRSDLRGEALVLFNAMLKTNPTPPHITCFSAHDLPHHEANGLLTMWRLYGRARDAGRDEGVGVALGFDTEKLRLETEHIIQKFGAEYVYLDRVRYGADDAEVQRRVDDTPALAELFANVIVAKIAGAKELPSDLTPELVDRLTVLFPTAKHQDFEDEREIRLVAGPSIKQTLKDRTPLAGSDGRVVLQYLRALDEVMVGPSNRQDDLLASISKKLKDNGFERVRVTKSATPFRFV